MYGLSALFSHITVCWLLIHDTYNLSVCCSLEARSLLWSAGLFFYPITIVQALIFYIMKTLSTLSIFFILSAIVAEAQFFNNDVYFDHAYKNPEVAKASCELPSGSIVTVGSISEDPLTVGGGTLFDGILNVHSPNGAVVGSYRYGRFGINEEFVAVIPSTNPSSNPEVIIIGEESNAAGNTDMLVLRVDINTGILSCEERIGSANASEAAKDIIPISNSPGAYIIVGTITGSNGGKQVYAARYENCNVIWRFEYHPDSPFQQDDHITPTRIIYDELTDRYIIAGNYDHRSGIDRLFGVDAFAMAIDEWGNLVDPIHVYDINGGHDTDTDIQVVPGDGFELIVAGGGFPSGVPYVSTFMIDPGLVAFPTANMYEMFGHAEDLPVGFYRHANGSGYDVAVQGYNQNAGVADIMFFQIDANGQAQNPRWYSVNENEIGTSIVRTSTGYLLKGSITNAPFFLAGYALVGVDFMGMDLGAGCSQPGNVTRTAGTVSYEQISTDVTSHGNGNPSGIPQPAWQSGLYLVCSLSGGSGGVGGQPHPCPPFGIGFRSPGEYTAAPKAQFHLFPSLLRRDLDRLNITFESESQAAYSVVVYNSAGQQTFRDELNVVEGHNRHIILPKKLRPGLSFIYIMDEQGKRLFTGKVLID